LRIAQVGPLYERTPPLLYGGTERVVSYLTEELVRQGHQVTLFASGDSLTHAELVSPCARALRLDPDCRDPLAYHIIMLDQVYRRAADFDVIHFHIDYLHFAISARQHVPQLTTLHGRLDLRELSYVYRHFRKMPLISISDSQRRPIAWANWRATVFHGLPENLYSLEETRGKYLAFIGRISPEKRVDRAIEVAKRTGMPLRIAAKVDPADREYFDSEIKPLLDHPLVEYIGEIGEGEKQEFLSGAYALLFLIDWPEPFGLAMIEAMACGTPVIAFRHGSVPEIIEEGKSGFIVDSVDQAVEAVSRAGALSRAAVRAEFDRRFTVAGMARNYVAEYRRLQSDMSAPALEDSSAPLARPLTGATPTLQPGGLAGALRTRDENIY
jgi:glycosyltransferase involved in cell wall biosynthesis